MTTEEKAKAYDEALERFRAFKEKYYTKDTNLGDVIFDKTGEMQKDFEEIFPELRESEDERIRKEIIEVLRLVPSSMWEQAKTNYERCFAYLEKQKELDKMIVVHPEIWDNAISNAFENGKREGEKRKEPNHEDEKHTDFTIYHPLKNVKGKYECIPYSFYGSLTSFSEDKDLIDFLRTCFYTKEECNEWIKQQEEQKLVQSDIEREYVRTLKSLISDFLRGKEEVDREYYQQIFNWLDGKHVEKKPVHTAKEAWKEMRLEVYAQASGNRHEPNYSDDSTKMFSLCDIDEIFEKIGNSTVGSQPAEWSEEDERNLVQVISGRYLPLGLREWFCGLPERFSSCPSWKPSEEQMNRLFSIIAALRKDYCDDMADFLANLYADLKKLGVKEEPEYYQHFDPDC